jgi:hypothetical protein
MEDVREFRLRRQSRLFSGFFERSVQTGLAATRLKTLLELHPQPMNGPTFANGCTHKSAYSHCFTTSALVEVRLTQSQQTMPRRKVQRNQRTSQLSATNPPLSFCESLYVYRGEIMSHASPPAVHPIAVEAR